MEASEPKFKSIALFAYFNEFVYFCSKFVKK